jgi:membrane protein implicated in regulation of membrane protease activity
MMLGEFVYWHWLALAVFLLTIELLEPGMFFLWMAQASLITGGLLFLFPSMSWEIQLLLFSVFSLVGIAVVRQYFKNNLTKSDQPMLNKRTAQYIGRVFTLEQAIINGQGKIRIDDSIWKVKGNDCPVGTRVKVIGAESIVLLVERVY